MIFQNQQANILRVNGALADIKANQPNAEGTFYIFYSLDTQEIWYDESPGNWIRLGSGGGGVGINIYNSDGTLTGIRKLNGNKNDLEFNNCGLYKIWSFNNVPLTSGFSINITDTNNSICTFGINPTQIQWSTGINNINKLACFFNPSTYSIDFQFNNVRQGLYFKYDTRLYQYGQITGGNQTYLEINDVNKVILAFHNGNANGVQINFNSRSYTFGDYNNINSDGFLGISQKLVQLVAGNIIRPSIILNGNNNIISSQFSNVDNGFQLDHNNRTYIFGQINGGNTNLLTINDITNTITTTRGGQTRGLSLNLNSQNYGFGSFGGGNGTALLINDGNQIISTQTNAGVNGIVLNFNAQSYLFGHGSSGLRTQLLIDNISGTIQTRLNNNPNGYSLDGFNGIYTFGCCNFSNRINFQIENTNKRFVTFHDGGTINGFDIVINTNIYKFGRIQGNNSSHLYIDDTNQLIKTQNQGNDIGLKLDFANETYQFGQLNGGNTTYLTIDDAAAFPVQIDGTNVLQGTSGPVSGQHLKIKVNGVDYVIELKDP